MHYPGKGAFLFLIVVGVCLAVECSEKITGSKNALPATGKHIWSKRFGDANGQEAQAVVVDASGNVFVTGLFEGAVDFDDGALTSEGRWDIFVAKLGR